jgi:alkaline phosphatase D
MIILSIIIIIFLAMFNQKRNTQYFLINETHKNIKIPLTFYDKYNYRILNNYPFHIKPKNVTRICFGSCNNQINDQKFWYNIEQTDIDLWIYLGDNVYSDNNKQKINMCKAYFDLFANEHFKNFHHNKIHKIGVWDDHDYHSNNKNYFINKKEKLYNKNLFLKFINAKHDDIRRKRDGIYTNYFLFSPNNDQIIQIILLDVRSFRSDIDILGLKQWKWLKSKLRKNIFMNIIISGTKVLGESQYDNYSNVGWSQKKMLDIISNFTNTIFISGDIHHGFISEQNGFVEITSSPLSSNVSKNNDNTNKLGKIISQHNFGYIDVHWDEQCLILGHINYKGTLLNSIKIKLIH